MTGSDEAAPSGLPVVLHYGVADRRPGAVRALADARTAPGGAQAFSTGTVSGRDEPPVQLPVGANAVLGHEAGDHCIELLVGQLAAWLGRPRFVRTCEIVFVWHSKLVLGDRIRSLAWSSEGEGKGLGLLGGQFQVLRKGQLYLGFGGRLSRSPGIWSCQARKARSRASATLNKHRSRSKRRCAGRRQQGEGF
ncbi:hypothetical protein ACIGXI_34650 [Kitasatospora aureofaciens]|uniref:hypothetical protein n=1 Tax=Kitasatospora aureofaciens TaxID=1894 RepID=UPI0037C6270C